MKSPHPLLSRLLVISILFATILAQSAIPMTASAAQIVNRSLTLQANGATGGSKAGGVVNHLFQFTIPGGSNVGSIKFEYCTTAAGTCTLPTGMSSAGTTLGSESGATGFTNINSSTPGAPYISRVSASNVPANTVASYQLQNITNPNYGSTVPDTNKTFFVRISTYATTDATGLATDAGTVTASTAEPIIIDGTMPESLVFCTGETIGLDIATSTVPDCSTATDGTISFDQLFSPTDTATSQSQMSASTNAGFGYSITVNGPTLTSGGNTIAGMATAGPGIRGTAQFGLNLKANTTTTSTIARGVEVAPTPNGSNFRGQATTNYGTADSFKFVSGDVVAASDNASPGATDAQIFTVSYIANVPGSQAAGTYTSTLTYICTPLF